MGADDVVDISSAQVRIARTAGQASRRRRVARRDVAGRALVLQDRELAPTSALFDLLRARGPEPEVVRMDRATRLPDPQLLARLDSRYDDGARTDRGRTVAGLGRRPNRPATRRRAARPRSRRPPGVRRQRTPRCPVPSRSDPRDRGGLDPLKSRGARLSRRHGSDLARLPERLGGLPPAVRGVRRLGSPRSLTGLA
jgi:hypothetical protein